MEDRILVTANVADFEKLAQKSVWSIPLPDAALTLIEPVPEPRRVGQNQR